MPKINFKSGIFASIFFIFFAFVAWPFTYDRLAEGPKLLRDTLSNSKSFKERCGLVDKFFIVPWKLSLDDSDERGNLELVYWFYCNGKMAHVTGSFHHNGGDWIIDTLELHSVEGAYNVKER